MTIRAAVLAVALGMLACEGAGGDSPPPDPAAAPRTGGGVSVEQPVTFDTTSRVDIGAVEDTAPSPRP